MHAKYAQIRFLNKIYILLAVLAVFLALASTASAAVSVVIPGIQREYLDQSGNNIHPEGNWEKILYLKYNEAGIRLRLKYIISGPVSSCVGTGDLWSNPKNSYSDTDPVYAQTFGPSTKTAGVRCTGTDGSISEDYATVVLPGPSAPIPPIPQNPTAFLSANPVNIQVGQNSVLSWNSTNATSCFNSWNENNSTSGTQAVFPSSTTTYTIICSNTIGATNASATVNVSQVQVQNPTVSIFANPSSINYGGNSIITWSSTNATSCNASGGANGWAGTRNTSGTFNTGSLTNTTTYDIYCTNTAGAYVYNSVSVSVGSQIPTYSYPTSYTYPNPYPIPYSIPYPTTSYIAPYTTPAVVPSYQYQNLTPYIAPLNTASTRVTRTTVATSGVGIASLVKLSVDGGEEPVSINDKRAYHIMWQNESNQNLTKVVLRVILPDSMTFESSTSGSFNAKDNILTFNIDTLSAGQGGEIFLTASINTNLQNNQFIVVVANLVYTNEAGIQGDATAYATHRVFFGQGGNSLVASVFGFGFLPGSLFGWLLLIIFILLLALIFQQLFMHPAEIKSLDPEDHH